MLLLLSTLWSTKDRLCHYIKSFMFSSPTKSCTKAPQILFIVQPFLMSSAHLYLLVSLFFSDWPCCCCCRSAVFSEIPLLFLPKSGLPASLRTNHWNCSTKAPSTTAKWVKNTWQCSWWPFQPFQAVRATAVPEEVVGVNPLGSYSKLGVNPLGSYSTLSLPSHAPTGRHTHNHWIPVLYLKKGLPGNSGITLCVCVNKWMIFKCNQIKW